MDWKAQLEMFMPHGMCLLWRPGLMSLHVVSDGLIALAYFTISFALWRFVRGRNDLEKKHKALALLFAAFIAFCGLTHIASIVVLSRAARRWGKWRPRSRTRSTSRSPRSRCISTAARRRSRRTAMRGG